MNTTARPWRVLPMWQSVESPMKIVGPRPRDIVVASVMEADAALIVEAVNAWGDTDALRRRIDEIEDSPL